MKKIIRRYEGKLGEIIVEEYEKLANANKEYHVKHSALIEGNYWTMDKQEAIRHAQFLASKY